MRLSTVAITGILSFAVVGNAQHYGDLSTGPNTSGRWFDRFVVVVLENTNKATALGNPYYQNLTTIGMLLDGYQGATHPSQPNYVTMIHSTIAAGVYDDANHNTTERSLIDFLEPAGISWRAYMEGYYPLANGSCNPISTNSSSGYARKHNPFMSFLNIRNSTSRCQNIVNAESNFALDNDAHDTNIPYTVTDLSSVVDTMLNNQAFMKNTLVIITFDENDIYSPQFFGTNNDVYTVLLGNDTLKCYNCVDQQFYNHFSQLTTIERNWNLPTIPLADGGCSAWDGWMLPFAMLRSKTDTTPVCAYGPTC